MTPLKPMNYQENYLDLLPEGSFRISPSSVAKFTEKKWEWYQENVLGNKIFEGSTSTVLGSCVHRIAESYIKTNAVDKDELYAYIDSQSNPEIDKEYIKDQFIPMGQALIDYLRVFGIPDRSEEAIACKIVDNVYAAGTADAVIGDTLIDFKTTSKTSIDETYMPNNYKWQLLTYAYIYRKMGVDINRIRIVWITNNIVGRVSEKTGKPLKDYPSQVIPVTQVITDEDMQFIEDYLRLIAETYLKGVEDPKLVYLLYSDYRLKEK